MTCRLTWEEVSAALRPGQLVEGTVLRRARFGVFVDVGFQPFEGLVLAPDIPGLVPPTTPDQYPPVGARVRARVLGFREQPRQIALTMRDVDGGEAS